MPASRVQAEQEHGDVDTKVATIHSDTEAPDEEWWRMLGFNDMKVLLAALKREVAANSDIAAIQQHIAQLLRAAKDAGDEITDEVEQEAYVTAITVAYNERCDRARAIKVDPNFAEEFPECFVSEPPVNEDDFVGSEAWPFWYEDTDRKVEYLRVFIKSWMGKPLPNFGEEVSEQLGRSPEWREKTLRRLYRMYLNAI